MHDLQMLSIFRTVVYNVDRRLLACVGVCGCRYDLSFENMLKFQDVDPNSDVTLRK